MAYKILSIDGGGIRGIIPGQILVSLESKLREKSNGKIQNIGECFDLVAGTSTGAILAAAYVCPDPNGSYKFNAQDAVDIYLNDGDEIFDVSFWKKLSSLGGLNDERYSAKALEESLEVAFGDLKISELLKPTCLVSYDIKRRTPQIFKQHTAISRGKDFLVRDALRGSSAAPTYFQTARIYSVEPKRRKYVLVDGGLVANDPTLCAYSEGLKDEKVTGLKDMTIVSLGTGKNLKAYSYPDVKDWGPLGWAKPSIDIALEGGPQMTEYFMKKISSTLESKNHFFRISPDLYNASPDLDNASPENIENLLDAGERNAEDFDLLLDEIVDELLRPEETE